MLLITQPITPNANHVSMCHAWYHDIPSLLSPQPLKKNANLRYRAGDRPSIVSHPLRTQPKSSSLSLSLSLSLPIAAPPSPPSPPPPLRAKATSPQSPQPPSSHPPSTPAAQPSSPSQANPETPQTHASSPSSIGSSASPAQQTLLCKYPGSARSRHTESAARGCLVMPKGVWRMRSDASRAGTRRAGRSRG